MRRPQTFTPDFHAALALLSPKQAAIVVTTVGYMAGAADSAVLYTPAQRRAYEAIVATPWRGKGRAAPGRRARVSA